MKRQPTRPDAANAGFTVFELLVMLAVLAASAMIVAPRALATRDAIRVDAAAHALAALLVKARADSIARSTPSDVVLEPRLAGYMAHQHAAMRRIGSGIAMRTLGFAPEASGVRVRVRFRPDGTATGGTIVLRNARSAASIAVDWLTGAVRVRRFGVRR
ncbi:MAG: GspH/FimT family pseudopilin [Hyphomicrobium sp.]|uniref:GspH/FimT family pseudopilin n=1 Tax=Hyphomicrobium sp. TaxID=82 RepID=UPI003D110B01